MRNFFSSPRAPQCGIALACLGLLAISFNNLQWEMVRAKIRRSFPSVPQLSTEALAARLAAPHRPKPLLLDVRTPAEFAVSHLPGAMQIDPNVDPRKLKLPADKGAPVVVYCSVGYRSSMLVQRLQEAGYTNVQNLDGSIFRWANEGRPLTDGVRAVTSVHPYDRTWGRLLQIERRAPLPTVP